MTETEKLKESILHVLLVNCQYNDSKRFLSGLRGPSPVHRRVLRDFVELYETNAQDNVDML